MALDKLPPVYTGDNRVLREVIEYENYLREQVLHELEVLKKRVEEKE